MLHKDQIILADICQNMSDEFVKELEKIYKRYCSKNAANEITPMLPVALSQACGWMMSAWATATQYPRTQVFNEFGSMFKQAADDQLKFEKEQSEKKIIN